MVGYTTVAEANTYIESRYSSTNVDRIRWEALSDDDKTVYLQQSVDALDRLPYHSRKLASTQEHAFPRWHVAPTDGAPLPVKHAQIENALKLSEEVDSSQYERMRMNGVESYSIGKLSEKLRPTAPVATGIVSAKAVELVRPYLNGGYCIYG